MQNIQGVLIKNLIWFSIFRLETMYNFRLHSVEVRAVVLYTVLVWCILVLSQKSQTRTHVRERATNKHQKKRKKFQEKILKSLYPWACACVYGCGCVLSGIYPPPAEKVFTVWAEDRTPPYV